MPGDWRPVLLSWPEPQDKLETDMEPHPAQFFSNFSLRTLPPQAGVWRDGKLEADMEEWQCALAVEGAGEAAAAARRVQVRWLRVCFSLCASAVPQVPCSLALSVVPLCVAGAAAVSCSPALLLCAASGQQRDRKSVV